MNIFAGAVGFIVIEVTHENISIRMVKSSLSFSLPAHPHADILRPVGPDLGSEPVFLLGFNFELSTVDAAISDLEVSHFFYTLHRFFGGRELSLVDYLLNEVKIFCIWQSTGST